MPHDHHHHHGDCAHGHSHGGHGHHHHHHHVPDNISTRFVLAAVLNMAFVVAELTAGFISKSVALIGDALHNFSDVVGLLLAWGGVWLMRLAPTLRRTYGYRSASYLAALINAGLLLLATGAMMLEAVERLFNPASVETGTVMLVAAIGIVINFGTGMLFHAGQKSDINIRGAYLHMMADAALSAGVVLSAALMYVSGWLWLDGAVGLVIAAFIIWSTIKLGREAMDMALAAVPSHIDPQAVLACLHEQEGVTAVHDLHIWPLSTTETALTVHLVAPERQGDDAFLQRVCAALNTRFGIAHTTIQVEADPTAAACTLVDHTAAA